MTMAARLQTCLKQNQSRYEVLQHSRTQTSRETARRAGISPDRFAKSVILDDRQGHRLMAVIPASRKIDLDKVSQATQRNWQLARETEFGSSFADCEVGAIPAVGSAFGIETLIDQSLAEGKEVYFEAGDHQGLVHMSTDQYLRLMPAARRGSLSS